MIISCDKISCFSLLILITDQKKKKKKTCTEISFAERDGQIKNKNKVSVFFFFENQKIK